MSHPSKGYSTATAKLIVDVPTAIVDTMPIQATVGTMTTTITTY